MVMDREFVHAKTMHVVKGTVIIIYLSSFATERSVLAVSRTDRTPIDKSTDSIVPSSARGRKSIYQSIGWVAS